MTAPSLLHGAAHRHRLGRFVMRLDAAAGIVAAGLVAAALGALAALVIARVLLVML